MPARTVALVPMLVQLPWRNTVLSFCASCGSAAAMGLNRAMKTRLEMTVSATRGGRAGSPRTRSKNFRAQACARMLPFKVKMDCTKAAKAANVNARVIKYFGSTAWPPEVNKLTTSNIKSVPILRVGMLQVLKSISCFSFSTMDKDSFWTPRAMPLADHVAATCSTVKHTERNTRMALWEIFLFSLSALSADIEMQAKRSEQTTRKVRPWSTTTAINVMKGLMK
mmetsp:Transcript_225/g.531  ORF Transcript_225/g.531 Transcript_225/m.531 type:complete len:224 (+) Transcript_225:2438-3109(+)